MDLLIDCLSEFFLYFFFTFIFSHGTVCCCPMEISQVWDDKYTYFSPLFYSFLSPRCVCVIYFFLPFTVHGAAAANFRSDWQGLYLMEHLDRRILQAGHCSTSPSAQHRFYPLDCRRCLYPVSLHSLQKQGGEKKL